MQTWPSFGQEKKLEYMSFHAEQIPINTCVVYNLSFRKGYFSSGYSLMTRKDGNVCVCVCVRCEKNSNIYEI